MRSEKLKRVFVAMSGGVDSSVAAFLLSKNKKYEVIGCFIKGYNVDGCQSVDAEDARRVAGFLGIPFYVIDLEKEYKKLVVDYMIDGYKKGITPNPDVVCNKEIKFGLFLKKALGMGADYVATGHYVKLAISGKKQTKRKEKSLLSVIGSFSLFVAKDKNKDQSYFLWALTQEQLRHCLFPIGDYLKSEVREIARKAGLPTANKKDSQGICFLGAVRFRDFLKKYLPIKKGDVLDVDGKKIGEHEGAHFYTIGQRHIGIMNYSLGVVGRREIKPFYVVKKDIKKNVLVATEDNKTPAFYSNKISISDVNFIAGQSALSGARSVLIRIRYRQPLIGARLICSKRQYSNCELIFDLPQKFIAPGQSAVFYDKNKEMIGGGVIV